MSFDRHDHLGRSVQGFSRPNSRQSDDGAKDSRKPGNVREWGQW